MRNVTALQTLREGDSTLFDYQTPGRRCAFSNLVCRACCGFMVAGRCAMLGEPRDLRLSLACDPRRWARDQMASIECYNTTKS